MRPTENTTIENPTTPETNKPEKSAFRRIGETAIRIAVGTALFFTLTGCQPGEAINKDQINPGQKTEIEIADDEIYRDEDITAIEIEDEARVRSINEVVASISSGESNLVTTITTPNGETITIPTPDGAIVEESRSGHNGTFVKVSREQLEKYIPNIQLPSDFKYGYISTQKCNIIYKSDEPTDEIK